MAVDVNRDNFETEVLEAKGPVLVDFWGPQCRPCLALMPGVEKLENNYAGRLKVTKLNAAENRMLCARLQVLSLPTFLFYKDGIEVKRLVGNNITEGDIKEAIDTVVA